MKIGIKILAAALVAALVAGCGDDKKREEPVPPAIYDGWKMIVWNDSEELAGKVYLQLNTDETFVLYQNINELGYRMFTGDYTVTVEPDAQVLSGTYSSGKPLKDSYRMESRDPMTMVLRSVGEGIESVYERVEIPDWVKDNKSVQSVRTADDEEEPFL